MPNRVRAKWKLFLIGDTAGDSLVEFCGRRAPRQAFFSSKRRVGRISIIQLCGGHGEECEDRGHAKGHCAKRIPSTSPPDSLQPLRLERKAALHGSFLSMHEMTISRLGQRLPVIDR